MLHTLVTTHPEYEITVLLRNIPPTFTKTYPNVKIVQGDYDSAETITEAASQANIVVHNGNSDHEGSMNALIAGLLNREAASPGFLIHLSGTGIVADHASPQFRGKLNPKIWSDVADISAIWSLPESALHRNVDAIIQSAWETQGEKLRTAIVCPPDIYGAGTGLARTASVYFPTFYAESLKLGATFYVNQGTNTRSWVHISDLMAVYLRLVEAGANGGHGAQWGREGYYFASSQEASQRDIAFAAGRILKRHGMLPVEEPREAGEEEVMDMLPQYGRRGIGLYMYAANSRTRSDRAREVLGYVPSAPSIWESMEGDLLAARAEMQK